MKKAHVTHPELKVTFCLDILGVKKNPNGASYTQLGVVTKGTIIEVRCTPKIVLHEVMCHIRADEGAECFCPGSLGKCCFLPQCHREGRYTASESIGASTRDGHVIYSTKCCMQVNVSELGLVTPGGKVVWGKYAQVTNNPENDGCINAVLLV